jgi:hypothetical protein
MIRRHAREDRGSFESAKRSGDEIGQVVVDDHEPRRRHFCRRQAGRIEERSLWLVPSSPSR